MSTPLHNSILDELSKVFHQAEKVVDPSYGLSITARANTECHGFEGPYAGSVRIPDLGVEFELHEASELRLVVEVGFSEEHEHLKESARVWLEGYPSVALVVLIKLDEDPIYRNPLCELEDDEIKDLNLPPSGHMLKELLADGTIPTLGPICYRGAQWTGRLSSVWVERWSGDENGKANKTGPGVVRRSCWRRSLP